MLTRLIQKLGETGWNYERDSGRKVVLLAEAAAVDAVAHSPHPFPSKVVMRGSRPVS